VLFVVGDKSNEAAGYSYDSSAQYAPKLHIEYATPTATPTSTPTATATPVGPLLVNSMGDGADANTGDGICQTSTPGECTLRAALQQANASAGLNTIQFNLPGPGPYTFQPGSAYPDITDAVIIDGTTQPGFAGTPIVEIDGSKAGGSTVCLRITGANSTVRGLVINRCGNAGIEIMNATATGNVVVGNYIGTDRTGTVALPNQYGVWLTTAASGNTIGGTTAADRNVISGNTKSGVLISWNGTDNNVVRGNYIGTNAAGTAALANGDSGFSILGGPLNNTLGGTTAGARNVISGNNPAGVYIAGGVVVEGNFIGTDATGTYGIPNAKFGVQADGVDATVGGTVAGAGNLIAYNTQDGLVVSFNGATGNSFLGNSVYANGHLGIDLKDNGVTDNDNLDKDNGPNDFQNFPVLTSARTDGTGTIIINGTLNSLANTTFRVEFFASVTGDPSGYGEGQRYLGYVSVTTNGSGDAAFSQTLSAVVAVGEVITSTATNSDGSTSEFSQGINAIAQ
jgi:CSLREA domain-containing protein